MRRPRDPDSDDNVPLPPAWCPECNALVKPKHIDMGIGPWEMGSQRGWHHDWIIGCPDCECVKLVDPPGEDDEPTECRRCGEIEPCSGPGLCETCLNQMRRNNPGVRL